MERINTSTKAINLFGAGKHGFTDGVPGTATLPTQLSASWFNAVQEEFSNVIEGAGFVLEPGNNRQLLMSLNMDQTAAEAAVGVVPVKMRYRPGDVRRYGADPTGANDSSDAFTAAVSQWFQPTGARPYAGSGMYRINATVAAITTSTSVFTQGFVFLGDGLNRTFIDSRVVNGPVFDIGSSASNKFQIGVHMSGFQIMTNGAPANSSGVRVRRGYMVLMENFRMLGLSGDGVTFVVSEGDADASNMVCMRNFRIENAKGWGINTAVTGPYNELSFLRLEHGFIQGCGTTSAAAVPPSGGIKWKGQIVEIEGGALTINENCGLYVEGGAGLANTVTIKGTAFENNKRRHVLCSGIDSFKARSIQLYSNDSYLANGGIEFDASTYTVRNVDIDGVIVRATAGNNAYTAFKISGGNAELNSCRVRNVSWQNFDYAGQTRFDGWQFDRVQQDCVLVAADALTLTLKPEQTARSFGNSMPLRLSGGAGGAPSTTGEWVRLQVPNGGLTITNAGVPASARLYCYLFDNNGAPKLELSTTAYVTDPATGYSVKSGDATRLYVGSVLTTAGSQFSLVNSGWLNPTPVAGQQPGTFAWEWYSGTSGALRRTVGALPTSDGDGALV